MLIEDGIITEISDGKCPNTPDSTGLIIPKPVNCHTHCADGAVKAVPGMSLEELVAPPNGLKHRYLKEASERELYESITNFAKISANNGVCRFVDFREGGLDGCRILRNVEPNAIILGRPISPEYDENEIDDILDLADGIGLPSISDIDYRYAEKIADRVRERNKIFSIHVSERIREDIDSVLSLDPSFVIHMTEATDEDMLKCAEADVSAVVCTRSNMFFGKIPPIKRLIQSGMNVSMGTDNAMLCDPDMRKEAGAFLNVLKKQKGNPDDVWNCMVFNGRTKTYKQPLADIAIGKVADVTVLPLNDGDNPLNALSGLKHITTY